MVNNPDKEVDVIICGGGAAGCVLAGRLATASPELKILVIESGIDNLDHSQVIKPAMYLSHLVPDTKTAIYYVGKGDKNLKGRDVIVPAGGMLGGGSSINFMMYTRASESDYNDWNQPGWAAKDLQPLLAKTETYHVRKDAPNHGYDGPLHVSHGGHQSPLGGEWFNVAKDYAKIPVADDLQGMKTGHGLEYWAKWIDPKTGRRSDAAHGFVQPHLKKPDTNLSVLCESKVVRVLFDTSSPPKAIGVEYIPNKQHQPNADANPKTVHARKLVVVASGSLSTPQILERSGVGKPEILEKAGIKERVADLGVGLEYQDHQLTLLPYRTVPEAETLDDYLRGKEEVHKTFEEKWKDGKGMIASNVIDVGAKIRPTPEELKTLGPAFQKRWKEYFENATDKPVMFSGLVNSFLGDHATVPPGRYFTVGAYLEYPFSRGSIHITGPSVDDFPVFDPGFLNDEADMAPQVWAYKKGREIARRMPSYRGELATGHPKFEATSAARCQDIDVETAKALSGGDKAVSAGMVPGAVPVGGGSGVESAAPAGGSSDATVTGKKGDSGEKGEIKDLVYSKEDDEAIEEFLRMNVGTTWHSMATCPMRPREKGGVVDARLNVYGTQNLKLCDLSICPGNVGANTYSTSLLVGEKAAVLVMEDFGIKVV